VTDRRGLSYREAMAYVGVRRRTFDELWRPRLKPIRAGTSLVFDRRELDALFDEMKDAQPSGGALSPVQDNAPDGAVTARRGGGAWETRRAGSRPKATAPGLSTSDMPAGGFTAAASKVLQMRRPG